MKNYYETLGVTPNATKDEIKQAYRKLSKKFHPDNNQGDTFFEEMFKKINEANEVLSDDAKRQAYDYKMNNQSNNNTQKPKISNKNKLFTTYVLSKDS